MRRKILLVKLGDFQQVSNCWRSYFGTVRQDRDVKIEVVKMKAFIVVIFCIFMVLNTALSNDMCRVNPEDRKECGWSGISEELCRKRGCCFNNKAVGMKWCYLKAETRPDPCSVNPEDRKECGYTGITEKECTVSQKCCFNNKYKGVKWCYFKA